VKNREKSKVYEIGRETPSLSLNAFHNKPAFSWCSTAIEPSSLARDEMVFF
jgi:hypothetical protein